MSPADLLLGELRRLAAREGSDVTLARFCQETGVAAATVTHFYGSWTKLRLAAGLPQRSRLRRIDRDVLTLRRRRQRRQRQSVQMCMLCGFLGWSLATNGPLGLTALLAAALMLVRSSWWLGESHPSVRREKKREVSVNERTRPSLSRTRAPRSVTGGEIDGHAARRQTGSRRKGNHRPVVVARVCPGRSVGHRHFLGNHNDRRHGPRLSCDTGLLRMKRIGESAVLGTRTGPTAVTSPVSCT